MSQQIINVGAAPNDGDGDPIRTAFIKCNDNFDQLFAGSTSNAAIENGNSIVEIATANGNVTMSVAGTANVIVVTATGQLVTGDVSASGALISNSVSAAGFTGAIQFRNSSGFLASNGNLAWDGANLALYAYKHMCGNGGFGTDEATLRIGNTNPHIIDMGGNATVINIGNSAGNVNFAGNVSVAGNVTGAYFTGNGAGLTGVIATGNVGSASQLANGTTSLNVPVANGNVVGNIGGTTNVYVLSNLGANINGYVNATGNITGNYFVGNGSQLTGLPASYSDANVATFLAAFGSNTVSTTGNVTSGNLQTSGQISATGNISTSTAVVANGIVTGNSLITTSGNIGVGVGTLTMIIGNSTPTTIYLGGGASNIYLANANSVTTVAGNLAVGAGISATGNVRGNYVLGNGSQLTNLGQSFAVTNVNSANYIFNGSFNDPTITLIRGQTYYFNISVGGTHPFWVKTAPTLGTGNAYSSGVTNNGITSGQLTFQVPWDAPSLLYYQCQNHVGMGGYLQVTDSTILQNGNSTVEIYGNGNVVTSVAGTANVMVVDSTGVNVNGNVTANNFVGGGAGTPTLSSATNLVLSAVTSVQVTGGGTFRLPSLTAAEIANIVAVNGDMVYNSTVNKFQGYENGAWGNLI